MTRARVGPRLDAVRDSDARRTGWPGMNARAVANRLLSALPDADRRLIVRVGDTVELIADDVLHQAGTRVRHVYFPIAGFVALIAPVGVHAGLEVAMVGNEGMIGTAVLLGVSASPLAHRVIGGGVALKVGAAQFRRQLEQSPALRRKLDRYACVKMQQIALTAACARYHVVEARLSRWLLVAHDHSSLGPFHATHELLAYLLGVRRVGITEAAGGLQKSGLIHYSRGEIAILDRRGLEARCCDCYHAANALYRRIVG